MDQHLRIPLDPLVKLLVCRRRVVDINLVRHNEARLSLARYNHVAEIPVVRLHVTLPGTKMQALPSSVVDHDYETRTYLFEELAERDQNLALLALLVWGSRVGRNI